MNKIILITATLCVAGWAHAALKPGDSLTAYEIKNVESGKQYCQVCAYGTKAGKIIAFGKLSDDSFWADLKKLQTLQDSYKDLGVFAQIIDSKDTKAIKAAADKHGIKFPVVIAVDKDWDKAYKVEGQSRVVYYAKKDNKIVWTSTSGLNETASTALSTQLKKDLAS